MEFKKYIGSQLIGKKLNFHCDCAIQFDVTGTIVDYEIVRNELVFMVEADGRIIQIGENHPNLEIKQL